MHPPDTPRHTPPARDAEFVASRDDDLPALLWGVAMAAFVSGALAYLGTTPQRAAVPLEPPAVSVLAA